MNHSYDPFAACFSGISMPELVTGKGVILSDIPIPRGDNGYFLIGKKHWKSMAKRLRKSGKHNGSFPWRVLFK